MIDFTSKLGEINDVEHNKDHCKIYPQNQVSLDCIMSSKPLKETRSVTMKILRNLFFLFKSLVKVELCYIFTINMFSTAENRKETQIILLQ